MFTKCANHECGTAFKVTAETLKSAMGMVRCTNCATVFNALSTIMDAPPSGEVTELTSQLKLTESGDRIVLSSASARLLNTLGRARSAVDLATDTESEKEPTEETDFSPDPHEPLSSISSDEHATDDGDSAQRQATVKKRTEMDEIEETMPPISEIDDSRLPIDDDGSFEIKKYIPSIGDLRHAFRNLIRQKKRSGLGLAAISFGVIALLLAGGFITWNNWALREATIHSRIGHIQILHRDYLEKGESDPFRYLLPNDTEIFQEIEGVPGVHTVTERISFNGLVSHGETSLPFLGDGVIAEKETTVSRQMTIIDGTHIKTANGGNLG